MTEYRAYILSRDGRIVEAVDFTSTDDATAKEHARKLAAAQGAELWQGKRVVAKIEAKQEGRLSGRPPSFRARPRD